MLKNHRCKTEKTLAKHAEEWYTETTGANPPALNTPEWEKMYQSWVIFAFANFAEAEETN